MSSTKTVRAVALAIALALAFFLSSCKEAVGPGRNELVVMLDNCADGGWAAFDAVDVSESGSSDAILATRIAQVREDVTQTAVCGGELRVIAFAGSTASTQLLFDGTLAPAGPTENARLNQVNDLVSETMETIETALEQAQATLPTDSTDIVGQFSLAAEYAQEVPAGTTLHVAIYTDGVQGTGAAVLNTADLTEQAAADLADQLPTVDLPDGTTVAVTGIGKTAGDPAPSEYVAALSTFFSAYCARTVGADHCTVTTY